MRARAGAGAAGFRAVAESNLMTLTMKILTVGACAALAACHETVAVPPNLFPADAAGGWKLVVKRQVPVSEAPDPVPRTSVDRLSVASYEGPGKLEARVYALSSPAVGVDLAQRWRPSADTVFFYRGRYFVVVKWQQADRKALEEFVRQLEGTLVHERSAP